LLKQGWPFLVRVPWCFCFFSLGSYFDFAVDICEPVCFLIACSALMFLPQRLFEFPGFGRSNAIGHLPVCFRHPTVYLRIGTGTPPALPFFPPSRAATAPLGVWEESFSPPFLLTFCFERVFFCTSVFFTRCCSPPSLFWRPSVSYLHVVPEAWPLLGTPPDLFPPWHVVPCSLYFSFPSCFVPHGWFLGLSFVRHSSPSPSWWGLVLLREAFWFCISRNPS